MQPYRVAEAYDPMTVRLFPYSELAGYIAQSLLTHSPELHTILDIACGTGNLTLPLAERGYAVTGLDIAPEMLAVAREKAAEMNRDIAFICQDMTEPFAASGFDAVACFYGGLNFLNSPAALRQCLENVYAALKPGGLFAFEQFSADKMRAAFSGTQAGDFGDFYVVTHSACDDDGQVRHNVTFFLRNEDGSYRREEERHRIRIHPFAEIKQLLAEVGFTLHSVEPIYPHVDAKSLADVYLFVAQKPAGGD
ncbi:MAG: class I SAM-dependent methyltransferase [Chloroflexi bacterium]|nr:class I SAM-dependent methyltransferase [Chloroflexota bacterium]